MFQRVDWNFLRENFYSCAQHLIMRKFHEKNASVTNRTTWWLMTVQPHCMFQLACTPDQMKKKLRSPKKIFPLKTGRSYPKSAAERTTSFSSDWNQQDLLRRKESMHWKHQTVWSWQDAWRLSLPRSWTTTSSTNSEMPRSHFAIHPILSRTEHLKSVQDLLRSLVWWKAERVPTRCWWQLTPSSHRSTKTLRFWSLSLTSVQSLEE